MLVFMTDTALTDTVPPARFRPSADLVSLIVSHQVGGYGRRPVARDEKPDSPWAQLTVEIGERLRALITRVAFRWIHEGRSPEILACRLPSGAWRWRDPDLRQALAHDLNVSVDRAPELLVRIAQEIFADVQVQAWTGAWGTLEAQTKGLWLIPGQRQVLVNFPPREKSV
jgi:hypothetical protein